MMVLLVSSFLCFIVPLINANPLQLEPRQTQHININFTVSGATFKSFENATTLKNYLLDHGYNYKVSYKQLAKYVAQVDQYFASIASSSRYSKRSEELELDTRDDSPIKTHTNSTSLKGGPSYTNLTTSANSTTVDAISFSDGNAACAGGAIQMGTTVSSSASSGKANSTGKVTGNSKIDRILVNATVADAKIQQIVNGGKNDALTGVACAAEANGASTNSSILTTLMYPVNQTGNATLGNVARSFCEAGISALKKAKATGYSTSGSQASLEQGVTAIVNCNGTTTSDQTPTISFTIAFKGTYSKKAGFSGLFTGSRHSSNRAACSS